MKSYGRRPTKTRRFPERSPTSASAGTSHHRLHNRTARPVLLVRQSAPARLILPSVVVCRLPQDAITGQRVLSAALSSTGWWRNSLPAASCHSAPQPRSTRTLRASTTPPFQLVTTAALSICGVFPLAVDRYAAMFGAMTTHIQYGRKKVYSARAPREFRALPAWCRLRPVPLSLPARSACPCWEVGLCDAPVGLSLRFHLQA